MSKESADAEPLLPDNHTAMERAILDQVVETRRMVAEDHGALQQLRTAFLGIDGQGGMLTDQERQWTVIGENREGLAAHRMDHPRRLTASHWIAIGSLFIAVVGAALLVAPLVWRAMGTTL